MCALGGCAYDPTRHICAVYDDTFFEIDASSGSILTISISQNLK